MKIKFMLLLVMYAVLCFCVGFTFGETYGSSHCTKQLTFPRVKVFT